MLVDGKERGYIDNQSTRCPINGSAEWGVQRTAQQRIAVELKTFEQLGLAVNDVALAAWPGRPYVTAYRLYRHGQTPPRSHGYVQTPGQ